MQATQLEQLVQQRTNYQIQNLSIECRPDCVTLLGEARSFYVKQLAQEGVRELLPRVALKNAIVVEPRIDHFVTAEAS